MFCYGQHSLEMLIVPQTLYLADVQLLVSNKPVSQDHSPPQKISSSLISNLSSNQKQTYKLIYHVAL